jgi:hypothetical protein
MTLREKFHRWLRTEPFGLKERPTLRESQCEVIADEFAVGFLNWIILKCDYQKHGIFEYQGEEYTNEKLLEIYKKEKGLL